MKALLKMGVLSGMIDINCPLPEISIPLNGGEKNNYLKEEMYFPTYDDIKIKRLVFRNYGKIEKTEIYQYIYEGVD